MPNNVFVIRVGVKFNIIGLRFKPNSLDFG